MENTPTTSVGQDLVMCEVIGGLRPWPTITEERVYTERVVLDRPLVATIMPESSTVPDVEPAFRREHLDTPLVQYVERLAHPWEFPDA